MRELGWPAFFHVIGALWLCCLGYSKHLSEKWRDIVSPIGLILIGIPYGAVTTNPVGPYGLSFVARLTITVGLYALILVCLFQIILAKRNGSTGAGDSTSLPQSRGPEYYAKREPYYRIALYLFVIWMIVSAIQLFTRK